VLLRTLKHASGAGWAFEGNDYGEAGAGHFYRPFWLLWNDAIYALFGARAIAFHVGNLALYLGVCLEVWLLARRLAGEQAAWIASIGFALYPRHGESVAWISGSTDLTAVVLGLGAVLCAISPWRLSVRLVAATALTVAAALSKEVVFVLPLLVAALFLLAPLGGVRRQARRDWVLPGAMALGVLGVAIVRDHVIGGVGGYTAYPWTLVRAVAVLATYVVAAVTPPDLQLLRYKVALALPPLVLALAAWRVISLRRGGEDERVKLVFFGAAWFGISLLPLLNIGVDLNNANGERLMFLGTVGLALLFAGLIRPGGARGATVLAAAAALVFGLSALSAADWIGADRLSNRVLDDAVALAPDGGKLVLLSVPENYRTAHVFTGGDMSAALEHAGASQLTTSFCTHVVVWHDRSGQIRFTRRSDGSYVGTTTLDAPFDVPVLRPAEPVSSDCPYATGHAPDSNTGMAVTAIVVPQLPSSPAIVAYFDGHDLQRCC